MTTKTTKVRILQVEDTVLNHKTRVWVARARPLDAEQDDFDLVDVSPRFINKAALMRWLRDNRQS